MRLLSRGEEKGTTKETEATLETNADYSLQFYACITPVNEQLKSQFHDIARSCT